MLLRVHLAPEALHAVAPANAGDGVKARLEVGGRSQRAGRDHFLSDLRSAPGM